MPMGWVALATGAAGALSANAAENAGGSQSDAAKSAASTQLGMFREQQANLAPWTNSGTNALNMLMTGLGAPPATNTADGHWSIPKDHDKFFAPTTPTTMNDFFNVELEKAAVSGMGSDTTWATTQAKQDYEKFLAGGGVPGGSATPGVPGMSTNGITPGMFTQQFTPQAFLANMDPSYKWRLDQGLDAVQNRSSAMGGVLGGNTLKALNDYAQGSASTEYGAANDRWNNMMNTIFGRLQTISGTGANAAGGIAGLGMGAATNMGNFGTGAAAAAAAGNVGATNAITNAGTSTANNYLLWKMMQQNQQPSSPSQPSMVGSFDPSNVGTA